MWRCASPERYQALEAEGCERERISGMKERKGFEASEERDGIEDREGGTGVVTKGRRGSIWVVLHCTALHCFIVASYKYY
jgi:hypothetical protein